MALQNYETVAQRLERFWTDHPSGKVITELLEAGSNYWIFKATIYKKADDVNPISTGHAHEIIGASQINKTSALEVCETSAVGRALALAGYHGSQIASAEEITRAKQRQNEPDPRAIKRIEFTSSDVSPAQSDKIKTIGVKKYLDLLAGAKTVADLMKAAETIANDNELADFQKDVLRGTWAERRAAIQADIVKL
jgi:hypothetical protein